MCGGSASGEVVRHGEQAQTKVAPSRNLHIRSRVCLLSVSVGPWQCCQTETEEGQILGVLRGTHP